MKQRNSAEAVKNLSEKLHSIDILRKFAIGLIVLKDCIRTLRTKVTSITLPFDSRKSRKLKRISQWPVSDVHTLYYNRAWAAPAVLLIRVMREPTWARWTRVGSRLLLFIFLLMPIMVTAQNNNYTRRTNKPTITKTVSSPSPFGEGRGEASKTNRNMPQIIKTGGGIFSKGELLRINQSSNTIESSSNGGRSWVIRCNNNTSYGTFRDLLLYGREILAATSKGIYVSTNSARSFSPRCTNTSYGTFRDLLLYGREILAATSKGIYVSTNSARSFSPRCTNTSSYGEFINLQDEGKTLLANTTKGLYYSTNSGRSWVRR